MPSALAPSRYGMPSSRNIRPASLRHLQKRNVTSSRRKPRGSKRRTRRKLPRKNRGASSSRAPKLRNRLKLPSRPRPPIRHGSRRKQVKKAEEAKVAEAERVKAAALAKAAEKEAERVKAAEAANAAREAKLAAELKAKEEKLAAEQKAKEEKVAAFNPTADKSDQQTAVDLPRSLQAELRRVGCNTGAVDGNWNAASRRSLDLFNKHAGLTLEAKVASVDALDAVKAKTSRVCPLMCDHGFRADGDRCTKITCRVGYEIGDDNTCEKIEVRKPTAKREEPKRERQERAKTEAQPAKPQASGQIICGQGGCRPVRKGCRIGTPPKSRYGTLEEICD